MGQAIQLERETWIGRSRSRRFLDDCHQASAGFLAADARDRTTAVSSFAFATTSSGKTCSSSRNGRPGGHSRGAARARDGPRCPLRSSGGRRSSTLPPGATNSPRPRCSWDRRASPARPARADDGRAARVGDASGRPAAPVQGSARRSPFPRAIRSSRPPHGFRRGQRSDDAAHDEAHDVDSTIPSTSCGC